MPESVTGHWKRSRTENYSESLAGNKSLATQAESCAVNRDMSSTLHGPESGSEALTVFGTIRLFIQFHAKTDEAHAFLLVKGQLHCGSCASRAPLPWFTWGFTSWKASSPSNLSFNFSDSLGMEKSCNAFRNEVATPAREVPQSLFVLLAPTRHQSRGLEAQGPSIGPLFVFLR